MKETNGIKLLKKIAQRKEKQSFIKREKNAFADKN